MVLTVSWPRTPPFPGVLDTITSLIGSAVGPITGLELRLPDTPLLLWALRKSKFTQSDPSSIFCCPRHVVLVHPATVLPLSLSFPHTPPPSLSSLQQRKQTSLGHQPHRSTPQSRNFQRLMDGRDVWNNLASRATGDAARDKTVANRIMLRFRPIAPKPVAGGSASGGMTPENTSKVLLSGKRAKRKYVRVRRNSACGRSGKDNRSYEKSEKRDGSENAVVTLQLMPEKAEAVEGSIAGSSWCKNVDLDLTVEKFEIPKNQELPRVWTAAGHETGERRVVESWVTVESVGDTCMNVGGLGCTDVEKVKNMESDTCPGFISDGMGRVGWVNGAYKRMVSGNEEGGSPPPEEVVVRLKVKDNVIYSYEAFTCGVRLQYTWQKEKWTKMVPCDVWKLDCGGFAWRLDMKAALSLGL